MPYAARKLTGGKYRVVNTATGAVKAKRTSKRKAEAQLRILNSAEPAPAVKPKRKRRRAKSRR